MHLYNLLFCPRGWKPRGSFSIYYRVKTKEKPVLALSSWEIEAFSKMLHNVMNRGWIKGVKVGEDTNEKVKNSHIWYADHTTLLCGTWGAEDHVSQISTIKFWDTSELPINREWSLRHTIIVKSFGLGSTSAPNNIHDQASKCEIQKWNYMADVIDR